MVQFSMKADHCWLTIFHSSISVTIDVTGPIPIPEITWVFSAILYDLMHVWVFCGFDHFKTCHRSLCNSVPWVSPKTVLQRRTEMEFTKGCWSYWFFYQVMLYEISENSKKKSKYKLFKMKNFIISSDFFLPAGVFENYFWAVWNFILFCIYLNMICTLYMWGHISLALHINPALEFMLLFPAQASQELGKDSL